jgi:CheY-like chemotaxis protein
MTRFEQFNASLIEPSPLHLEPVVAHALVVDDDPMVCELLGSMLKELGYRCYQARNVASAITAAIKHERFRVAFIDLGLPDRSGLELVDELRELQPDLRFVLATGYADRVRLDMHQTGNQMTVLEKPFTYSGIKRALIDCGLSSD